MLCTSYQPTPPFTAAIQHNHRSCYLHTAAADCTDDSNLVPELGIHRSHRMRLQLQLQLLRKLEDPLVLEPDLELVDLVPEQLRR